jgi:hypothetical protein
MRKLVCLLPALVGLFHVHAQQPEKVRVVSDTKARKVDVFVGKKLFTTFLYPDTLEKPVLYPLHAANGTVVTRGFPFTAKPNDPTDHPHQVGMWFTFENINNIDFWNNSYAIKPEQKATRGWIKTDRILEATSGPIGTLAYHANWTNQQNEILLEETTRLEFSGTPHQRIIDRITTLTARTNLTFNDAKDGLLGLRLAHELQIPTDQDQKFTSRQGQVTVVKGGTDKVPAGTFLTSAGKRGNDAWGTRAAWCKAYGKIGADSISVTILDHPGNPNYPAYWHARGYGLFAINPFGDKQFTNGQTVQNWQLLAGKSVSFRYRILLDEGRRTPTSQQLDAMATDFAKKRLEISK